MTHLALLLLLAGLIPGLVVVTIAHQEYRRLKSRYLYSLFYFLICFNIILFTDLVYNYLLTNIFTNHHSRTVQLITLSEQLIPFLLMVPWVFYFLSFTFGILGKTFPKAVKIFFIILQMIISFIGIYYLVYSLIDKKNQMNIPIMQGMKILVVIVMLWGSVNLIVSAKNLPHIKRQKKARVLGYLFTAIFFWPVLALIMDFAFPRFLVSNNFIAFFFYMFVNVGLMVYFKRSWLPGLSNLASTKTAALNSDILIKKYGITPREEEIICLIVRGKTNQEIADELYLSIRTVKNYLYNLYQKLGIKNRVQLTNLIHGNKLRVPE